MTDPNTAPERYNVPALFKAFLETFDVNKGFMKTYRLLAKRPGESIRKHLLEDRSVLTKPMRLLLVSTAIMAFITINIMPNSEFEAGFTAGYNMRADKDTDDEKLTVKEKEEKEKKKEQALEAGQKIMEGFKNYFNVIILLFLPFISLGTYLFYKKSGYYFAEHFVVNSYILSFQNLIYFLMLPFMYYSFIWGSTIYMIVAYGYFYYALHRFFKMKLGTSIWRSTLALLIGYIFYFVAFFVISILTAAIFVTGGS